MAPSNVGATIVDPAIRVLQVGGASDLVLDGVRVGIAVLSFLLFSLSFSTYRRTRLKALLYASISFVLFSLLVAFEVLEDVVGGPFGAPYNEYIAAGITLLILVLFFLAIVRGNGNKASEGSPSEPD